jgi:glycosyltransferase involved in cell wall biosynthesis
MADSDLYVMSSLGEGLPNSLIQALCTGTPVVSTRCPTGPADLLMNGRFGKLVDVGDVVAMAETIKLSLETEGHDVDRQAHFMEKYDQELISKQYLSAFFKV